MKNGSTVANDESTTKLDIVLSSVEPKESLLVPAIDRPITSAASLYNPVVSEFSNLKDGEAADPFCKSILALLIWLFEPFAVKLPVSVVLPVTESVPPRVVVDVIDNVPVARILPDVVNPAGDNVEVAPPVPFVVKIPVSEI